MTPPQGPLSIERMCALTVVSRAAYYGHWRVHAPREEETALRHELHRFALANRFDGYRRLTEALHRAGWAVNHKRVLRLLRSDGLLAMRRRPFVPPTTDSDHRCRVVPNLVRTLHPTSLDQVWVADITYLRLREGFAFLAVVLDAFRRRVIGWAIDSHLQASLALAALHMALTARQPRPGMLIHHSDRGVQYACHEYGALLEAHVIQPSMSRVGSPWENAKAESFMKTLKHEEVDGRPYPDIDDARTRIGPFIEEVYNRRRLHSALAYLSPAEFEATARPAPAAAVVRTCH